MFDALVTEFIVRDRNRYTDGDIRAECHHISGGLTHVEPNRHNGKIVRIYNPLPYKRNEVRNLEIVSLSQYSETHAESVGYETINSFVLKDETGNSILTLLFRSCPVLFPVTIEKIMKAPCASGDL